MSKKITAYIAGKVSGLSAQQAAQHFADMQHELLQSGYNVINPVEELRKVNDHRRQMGEPPLTDKDNRRHIMSLCLYNLLLHADELHLMPDWQLSPGATLERDVAMRLGIPVVYHTSMPPKRILGTENDTFCT